MKYDIVGLIDEIERLKRVQSKTTDEKLIKQIEQDINELFAQLKKLLKGK